MDTNNRVAKDDAVIFMRVLGGPFIEGQSKYAQDHLTFKLNE